MTRADLHPRHLRAGKARSSPTLPFGVASAYVGWSERRHRRWVNRANPVASRWVIDKVAVLNDDARSKASRDDVTFISRYFSECRIVRFRRCNPIVVEDPKSRHFGCVTRAAAKVRVEVTRWADGNSRHRRSNRGRRSRSAAQRTRSCRAAAALARAVLSTAVRVQGHVDDS